jgi:choline monooxygenase
VTTASQSKVALGAATRRRIEQDSILPNLKWFEPSQPTTIDCNWKVFVDNYLDGGYHVPASAQRFGQQCSIQPIQQSNAASDTACNRVRWSTTGEATSPSHVKANAPLCTYWIYPNFMINCYEGVMDTNLVRPITVDKTEVVFDFYFTTCRTPLANETWRVSQSVTRFNRKIWTSARPCSGFEVAAYDAGRCQFVAEAGEHLFHRLLSADLKAGVESQTTAR